MQFSSGLPETTCGKGSTLASTVSIRVHLPGLLRRLGIRHLIDVPCGDLNWIAEVDLTGIAYDGIDIATSRLAIAASKIDRLNAASVCLTEADVLTVPLPHGDAVLCRDFFQHLPTPLVWTVLGRFLDSGAAWLLATSHDAPVNAELETIGGFRPLNLLAAPFSLGPPVEQIDDPPGSGRILGAWSREAVSATQAAGCLQSARQAIAS
jgi:hypothetical protein